MYYLKVFSIVGFRFDEIVLIVVAHFVNVYCKLQCVFLCNFECRILLLTNPLAFNALWYCRFTFMPLGDEV